MNDIEEVKTNKAPGAIGLYSQAVVANGFVFCSGQIPFDPETGELVGGDIKKQTQQVIQNLKAVLVEAGCSLGQVVKTEVFLTDLKDFAEFNEVYAKEFTFDPKPARFTVGAAQLPKGALIEISCVAVLPL